MDTFGGCVDHEAEMDPRQACINIMTQRGHFDLYSNNDKAQVCQLATHAWDDVKSASMGQGGTPPDVCAVLTSHIFQAYSWHLQDLSDGIIGALTEKLSEKLQKNSANYQN